VDAEPGLGLVGDRVDDVAELGRHHAAVGVAQRDHARARLGRGPDAFDGVGRVGPVAVEEVLGVDEDPLALCCQVSHRVGDHRQVLVERGAQGELDVPVVALGHEGDDGGA
jgi:hypothetical protein